MTTTEPASGSASLLEMSRQYRPMKGPPCYVGLFFTTHPDLADELREAMASEVPSTAITTALRSRGIDLGEWTIGRHRRGACRCPR